MNANDGIEMVKLGPDLLIPVDALPQGLKNRWQVAQSKAAAGENVKNVIATLLHEIAIECGPHVLLRAAPKVSVTNLGLDTRRRNDEAISSLAELAEQMAAEQREAGRQARRRRVSKMMQFASEKIEQAQLHYAAQVEAATSVVVDDLMKEYDAKFERVKRAYAESFEHAKLVAISEVLKGAVLKIFSGAVPASCSDPDPGVCLASISLPETPFKRDGDRLAITEPFVGWGLPRLAAAGWRARLDFAATTSVSHKARSRSQRKSASCGFSGRQFGRGRKSSSASLIL